MTFFDHLNLINSLFLLYDSNIFLHFVYPGFIRPVIVQLSNSLLISNNVRNASNKDEEVVVYGHESDPVMGNLFFETREHDHHWCCHPQKQFQNVSIFSKQ